MSFIVSEMLTPPSDKNPTKLIDRGNIAGVRGILPVSGLHILRITTQTPPVSTLLIPAASSIHHLCSHLQALPLTALIQAHEKRSIFYPASAPLSNATSLSGSGGIASLDHRLMAVNPPGSDGASLRASD